MSAGEGAAKRYWVVTVIQNFDGMELAGHFLPATLKTVDEPHYYLPVFTSLEAAVAWSNGSHENIHEMQETAR